MTSREFERFSQKLENLIKNESVKDNIAQIETRQKKQENMLEESLDLLDECQESMRGLKEVEEERQKQAEESEKKLLQLIMTYGESMNRISSDISGNEQLDPGWKQQMELTQMMLKRAMEEVGISMISDEGLPADPARVQVVDQELCSEREKHNCVKSTVIPGWIYGGRILKKAKVSVYKYQEELEDGRDYRN